MGKTIFNQKMFDAKFSCQLCFINPKILKPLFNKYQQFFNPKILLLQKMTQK